MSDEHNHVLERLAELSVIGRHPGGINRALATPAERTARERFAAWAQQSGFTVTQDGVGNVFARRPGTHHDAAPIIVGSHLDTVPTGGAYDGAYGVIAALCALEILEARGIATSHPVEAAAWAGEEGSRFPLGCLGSSAFAGLRAPEEVLAIVGDDGVIYRDALASPDGGLLDVPMRANNDVRAYLELHVEQGPILEAAGVSLGIVTAIAAQRRMRAVVVGTSGHAGTVPMSMRSDALCAAAELVLALERAARACGDHTVATVGRMLVEPNGTNVVPGHVTFSLDFRSPDERHLDSIEATFHDEARRIERERNVRIDLEALEQRSATPMTPQLREAIGHAISGIGERAIDVPSGAGHDAMSLGKIVPTAMIFVPSIGGASHVDEERTSDDDLKLGVEALVAAIIEVDRTLEGN